MTPLRRLSHRLLCSAGAVASVIGLHHSACAQPNYATPYYIGTLAGGGSSGSVDGTGTNATFNSPSDVAVDVNRNVYVADSGNGRIRKISPAGVVTTLSGSNGVALSFGLLGGADL